MMARNVHSIFSVRSETKRRSSFVDALVNASSLARTSRSQLRQRPGGSFDWRFKLPRAFRFFGAKSTMLSSQPTLLRRQDRLWR